MDTRLVSRTFASWNLISGGSCGSWELPRCWTNQLVAEQSKWEQLSLAMARVLRLAE